ncbi:MAG: methyl-accepting chemotaxis protein [bacterium]
MNWIKNLKIAQKILAFVALSSLFIAIVGFVGFHFTTKAGRDMSTMYKDRTLPIGWLYYANAQVWKIKCDILDAAIDKNEREMRTKEIEEVLTKLNTLIKNYSKTKLDPYEINHLESLNNHLDQLNAEIPQIVSELRANNINKTYELFFKNKKLMDNLKDEVKALAVYNNKVAAKIDAQNDKDTAEATLIIIVTILSSLITSISIGLAISKMISNPINNVVNNLNEVAQGNLSIKDLTIASKDETGLLSLALNETVKSLKSLITSLTTSISDISASSEEMAASADQTALGSQQTATTTAQLAQGAQEISRSVEQGAVTITKMNKVIQEISEEAKTVAKLGNDTEINANQGSKHVQNAIGKIDNIKTVSADISITVAKLGTLSSEIETIVDLIKGIAGQTNLLALNAAIEAARAGEQGKGFAVVAEEVKKLATQSAEATDKITDMIKEIQTQTGIAVSKMDKATNEVQEGVTVVNEAGKALDQIISQVKTANSKIQEITKEIDGVAHNSEDVVRMIENISAITEETAASAEEISSITQEQTASMQEISAGSQSLAQIAEKLNEKVSVFNI